MYRSPENDYCEQTSLEYRKKYAQFFTPLEISDFMSKWLIIKEKVPKILDPAFGLGIFARSLLKINPSSKIFGYEIDENIANKAMEIFGNNENVVLNIKDYMFNDWENKYDGIICNPPYFKFHDYENKTILQHLEEKIQIKLTGFTNLYAAFLIKSVNQLNVGGRCAYIVPSEFMNSDYGINVKKALIESNLLRYVIVFDFTENLFDDALTTSSILLFCNDTNNKVEFIKVNGLDDFHRLDDIVSKYPQNKSRNNISLSLLNPNVKWRSYYHCQNSKKYNNLIPFCNWAKVVRGIASGANDYFVFNLNKSEKFSINEKFLLPCITRASDAPNPFFTKKDFEELKNKNKNVFLLNAVNSKDNDVNHYIKIGFQNKINEKYLTSKRNPWYLIENRPPSPIWVSVFNRNSLRFIRNEAEIRNLTTFHCLYINSLYLNKIDLFFSYLLCDISIDIFNDNRREYGNGLHKFEPNDINNSKIIDLSKFDFENEKKILNYYYEYRNDILDKKSSNSILNEMNNLFTEYFAM